MGSVISFAAFYGAMVVLALALYFTLRTVKLI